MANKARDYNKAFRKASVKTERQAGRGAIATGKAEASSVYHELIAAGCELDGYESDLYVKDTAKAREIIETWRGLSIKYFVSPIDGAAWIEIPFMFEPFWSRYS